MRKERKCPHCSGDLSHYEDPAAVKMIADLTEKLEAAIKDRDALIADDEAYPTSWVECPYCGEMNQNRSGFCCEEHEAGRRLE